MRATIAQSTAGPTRTTAEADYWTQAGADFYQSFQEHGDFRLLDDSFFDELERLLFTTVFRYDRRQESEDVYQATMLALITSGRSYEPTKRLDVWIKAIASNKRADSLRVYYRRDRPTISLHEHDLHEIIPDPKLDVEAAVVNRETLSEARRRFSAALARLPGPRQQIIHARYGRQILDDDFHFVADPTYQYPNKELTPFADIAARLGMKRAACAKLGERALKDLRNAWTRLEREAVE